MFDFINNYVIGSNSRFSLDRVGIVLLKIASRVASTVLRIDRHRLPRFRRHYCRRQ
jgi:hypothetical protein